MSPIDAAHHVVLDFPGGSEALAPRLGKQPSTLRAETNPNLQAGTAPGQYAKLGLMTAVALTNLTGDARIVHAFNEACGFAPPLPLPQTATDDGSLQELLERGAELSKSVAEMFGDFQTDISDGKVTARELVAFEQRALAVISDVAFLVRAMQTKMENDLRSHATNVTSLKTVK